MGDTAVICQIVAAFAAALSAGVAVVMALRAIWLDRRLLAEKQAREQERTAVLDRLRDRARALLRSVDEAKQAVVGRVLLRSIAEYGADPSVPDLLSLVEELTEADFSKTPSDSQRADFEGSFE